MSREMGWREYQPDPEEVEGPEHGLEWSPAPPGTELEARPTVSTAPRESPASPATAGVGDAERPRAEPASERIPGAGGLRLAELVWLCVGVVDAFLALDFLLQAVGAVGGSFADVVERVGGALANPFAGVFAARTAPQVGHTTFWAALLAVVVYTIAGWLAVRLVRLLAPAG